MNHCCGQAIESKYAQEEAERKKKDEEMMNTEMTLNGVKLKLKDMFPDSYGARDFYTKLNLLSKSKGGKDMLDVSPASIMDDEDGDE